MNGSRCKKHDLALGPDGQCVVCRRESLAPARVPRWIFGVGGLTLLVLGAVFVMKSLPPPAATAPAAEASRAVTGPAPLETPVATAPAFLRDVARTVAPARTSPPPTSNPTAAPTPSRTPTADDVMVALKQVPITMYSTTWCPHCERARRWFRANSIPFVEYDVEQNSDAKRAQRKLNPKGGVPTIDIDGVVEVGFSEQRVGNAIARSVQKRLRERR